MFGDASRYSRPRIFGGEHLTPYHCLWRHIFPPPPTPSPGVFCVPLTPPLSPKPSLLAQNEAYNGLHNRWGGCVAEWVWYGVFCRYFPALVRYPGIFFLILT